MLFIYSFYRAKTQSRRDVRNDKDLHKGRRDLIEIELALRTLCENFVNFAVKKDLLILCFLNQIVLLIFYTDLLSLFVNPFVPIFVLSRWKISYISA